MATSGWPRLAPGPSPSSSGCGERRPAAGGSSTWSATLPSSPPRRRRRSARSVATTLGGSSWGAELLAAARAASARIVTERAFALTFPRPVPTAQGGGRRLGGECNAVRRAAAAAVAGLLAFAAFAPTPALGTAGEEGDLLSLVNGLRSSRGLRPVAVHPELQALAGDWARRMAAAQAIFHSPLNTRVDVGWVRLGEHVAVDAWVRPRRATPAA